MDAILMAMAAATETIEALRELARMAKARADEEDPTAPGWQSLAKVTVIMDSLAADLDASVSEAAHGIVAMKLEGLALTEAR